MKIAVVGSRGVKHVDLKEHLLDCDEIISGCAEGVDRCAKEYAKKEGISYVEYLPEYDRYKRAAPLVRNRKIVERADLVLIFWDGVSSGSRFVIEYAEKIRKPYRVIRCEKDNRGEP